MTIAYDETIIILNRFQTILHRDNNQKLLEYFIGVVFLKQ